METNWKEEYFKVKALYESELQRNEKLEKEIDKLNADYDCLVLATMVVYPRG
jgi:hypothetical protein